MTRAPRASRLVALALVATFSLPTLAITAGCGSKNNDATASQSSPAPDATAAQPSAQPTKPGLSTKQKVVLLAGAALLFYLYKRDQANNAAAAQNAGTVSGGKPQLYREDKGPNKGAIYYRDANHQVVWLKAPAQGVQVPADQVQQYLPDYDPNNPNAYQGQVNPNPQAGVNGGSVQSADQYAGASS